MKKSARPAISQTGETVRASTGRGGTRRDTKGQFVSISTLAGAVMRDVIRKREN